MSKLDSDPVDEKTGTKVAGNEAKMQKPVPKLDIFNGPILSTTIKMSIPILISQILGFAYIIVDTFFISLIDRQSTALLSGTGLIFPIYLVFFTIGRSLFIGMSSVTARGIGQKNKEAINKTADSGLFLALIISVVALILCIFFGKSMILFLAGSKLTEETINYAMDFFYFMVPGMIFSLIYNTLGGIVQGEGLAKHYGYAATFLTVINIILNPILIFVFKLGVKGSGLASSIAVGSTIVYFVILFKRKKTVVPIKWNILKFDNTLIKEILRIGVPASIGMLLINISAMVLNNVVGSISQGAMNAWVLVSRTDQFFLIPAYTIGLTTIPLIGQNYGRGNIKRTKKIYNVNLLLCVAVCALFAIFYMIFAPQIFRLFSDVPDVIANSAMQVRVLALTMIGIAGLNIIASSFQATGRPMPNLINNIIRFVITSIPLFLPIFHFNITNMTPVFICVGAGNLVSFVIAFIWGRSHFKALESKGKGLAI